MAKGKIVFLNGVTSAGKTSLVDAIQDTAQEFYYVLANDLFEQTIGDRYRLEDYWKYLGEAVLLMYQTAKLFSDLGHNVLIDGILVEQPSLRPHYERVREIFAASPFYVVHVDCPLTVCRARTLLRDDRRAEQPEEQAAIMAEGIRYDCAVRTDLHSPEECARQILAALGGK